MFRETLHKLLPGRVAAGAVLAPSSILIVLSPLLARGAIPRAFFSVSLEQGGEGQNGAQPLFAFSPLLLGLFVEIG